ncbi:hypothetical protein EYR36_000545 [Pleurotus pulmonarius]|nr:hypothetical protein EYR36_004837 [Pleurotus pulmonarius]KAF4578738.1 hypothetical protein EYR36_000545 [Pleurotus pulmonarius]
MQSLRLRNTTSDYLDTTMMISQVFKIQMPSLQTLVLFNVDLPSTIPLLPRLRRFVVTTNSCSMSPRLLLSTLRRMPNLEELEFEHSPSKPLSRGLRDYSTVELSKLSLLSLKARRYDISMVFKSIHYPPSSRVIFSTTEVPDLQILVDMLTHFAHGHLARKADEVLISDSPSQFNLKASVDGVPSFHINCNSSDLVRVELLRLATMIPSSNVGTLLLRGYNLVERSEWTKLFVHFDKVIEVNLLGERGDFIRILTKLPSDDWVPLPNLEVLTLDTTLIDRSFSRAVESLVAQHRAIDTPPMVFKLRGHGCMIYLGSSEYIKHEVSFVWDSADLTLEEVLGVHDDEDKDSEYSQDQYNPYDYYEDHDYEYYL